jgi:hypothetical protein
MAEDFVGEFESIQVADFTHYACFFESYFNGLGSADVTRTSRGGQQQDFVEHSGGLHSSRVDTTLLLCDPSLQACCALARLTPELTGREVSENSIQVLRMTSELIPLRLNELLGCAVNQRVSGMQICELTTCEEYIFPQAIPRLLNALSFLFDLA